jgi:site-specific recombinase XerD
MPQPPVDASVASLCDLFPEWCEKHNSARTYELYRDFPQSFCKQCGRMRVTELKPFSVNQWLDRQTGWREARRGAIIAVKRVFNWSVDEGLIAISPVRSLRKPPAKARTKILSATERQGIIDSYREDDPFRDFFGGSPGNRRSSRRDCPGYRSPC